MKTFITLVGLLLCFSCWAERDPTGAPVSPEQRPQTTFEAESTSTSPPTTSAPNTTRSSHPRLIVPEAEPPQHETSQPQRPSPPPSFETEYHFVRASNDCISDAPFSLQTQNTMPPVQTRWFIKTPSRMLALQTLPADAIKQIKLQLQSFALLQPGLSYPLYFQLSHNNDFQHSHISLIVCEERLVNDTPHSGELLVLIDKSELTALQRYTNQHHIAIREQTPLYGERILIVLKPEPATLMRTIEQLQQVFPKLHVDTNDYLTQVEGPRTYAKTQLKWPEEICQSTTVPIGIIDGAIDQNHPSLVDRAIITRSFIEDAMPDTDHATAISVILSGNKQNVALQGLLGHAELYVANVMEETLFGHTASVSAIIQALAWLSSVDIRLVNISLSGKKANRVFKTVSRELNQSGMVIFAAVGNNADKANRYYPAAFEGVIAVTAIDAAKKLYRSANQGDYIDFAAPGVDLWTADDEEAGQYRSGTSYATPHVVAAAANLLSMNPQMPQALIYQSLKASAIDLGAKGHDEQFGWGAVQYLNTCPQ